MKPDSMPLFLRRLVAIALVVPLSFILLTRGIVPAMSAIDSDFPNYIVAAKLVADGGDVARLYDDRWFQDQVQHYRIDGASGTKFSPFPPPTALLLVPLAGLEPLDALRVVTCVSVLCLILSILLLSRILRWRMAESAVFILFSGYAVLNSLRLGQPYILVATSCIVGYYARQRGRPWTAGLCFGLFSPIKYFPIIFIVYFAFRKEWKLVLGGAAMILAVSCLSISVLGWKIHQEFLFSVLGNHLTANLSMQNPFTASFQSVDTLFRRLFVFDAALNPRPLFNAPQLDRIGVPTIKVLISLLSLVTLVKLARQRPADSVAPSVGILGVVTLLLAPATATYHFALLWLPVALLIDYLLRVNARLWAYGVLGAYTLIGFFPYKYTSPFEGRGGWTLLAFPRLFLLLAIFIAAVHIVWGREPPENSRERQLP